MTDSMFFFSQKQLSREMRKNHLEVGAPLAKALAIAHIAGHINFGETFLQKGKRVFLSANALSLQIPMVL